MAVKQQLETRIGFPVPSELVQIVEAFSKKAGGFAKGLKLLETYIGLGTGIRNQDEGRGYEATPVELFPFCYTGGDGQMYGYINAAPELNLPDLPMASFVPGESDGVVHIGDTTRAAIENLISYIHADGAFAEVDLQFLNVAGLVPSAKKADNVRLLDGDEYVRPKPALPKRWKQVMTGDGVGVVAEASQFRPGRLKRWSYGADRIELLVEADRDLEAGFLGSVLYHLKEAWWLNYHDLDKAELKELKQRLVDAYQALGKSVLADVLNRHFDWI